MLRDIPRIYMSVFGLLVVLAGLLVWNLGAFSRDSDILALNTMTESTVAESLDLSARAAPGAFLLTPDFEVSMWEQLTTVYPDGAFIQFDYAFDATDTRFDMSTTKASSPLYVIGTDTPDASSAVFSNRSVTEVRVFVRLPGDEVTPWTYRSTVTIDGVGAR